MADILHVAEIWTLVAMLATWCLARAALRLRERPSTLAEVVLAEREWRELHSPSARRRPDPDSLCSALRVYEDEGCRPDFHALGSRCESVTALEALARELMLARVGGRRRG